jgi:hypothetical protein
MYSIAHVAWSLDVESRNLGDCLCSRPRIHRLEDTRSKSSSECCFLSCSHARRPMNTNASKNIDIVGSKLGIRDSDWISICDNDCLGKSCRISTPSIRMGSRMLRLPPQKIRRSLKNMFCAIWTIVTNTGWWHRGNAPPSHGGDPGFDSLSFHVVLLESGVSLILGEFLKFGGKKKRDFSRFWEMHWSPLVVIHTYEKGALVVYILQVLSRLLEF